MTLIEGQGLLLQLPFADNGRLSTPRTFMVIGEEDGYIKLLNVSSTVDKRAKLLMDSNEEIVNFKPPFTRPSMIKMDALYKVENCPELQKKLLARGATLDNQECHELIAKYLTYSSGRQIATSIVSATQFAQYQRS